jgi:hypothetical protein
MSRRRTRGNTPLPPERVIEDFTAWLIAGGFSHEAARSRADRIREFHCETGMNFLTMTPEELVGFIAECDRQLDELEREEAEDLEQPDLGKSVGGKGSPVDS